MVSMINNDKEEIKGEEDEYRIVLKWRNIIAFIFLHVTSVWALVQPPVCLSTYVFQAVMVVAIGFGTTVSYCCEGWENIWEIIFSYNLYRWGLIDFLLIVLSEQSHF